MRLNLTVDTRDLDKMARALAEYKGTTRKNMSGAMNLAAKDARQHLVDVTPRYVSKPTRWTLNSTFVKQSNSQNLEVVLGFKDYAVKGTPAAEYLEPMIKGGGRNRKGGENLLSARGLGGQRYMVPTGVNPFKFNQYGNITSGNYTKLYSGLRAMRDQGSTSNRAARTKSRFFVGEPNGLPLGIYARVGRKQKGFHTIFYLTRQPKYEARFPVSDILQREFNRKFPGIFSRLVFKAK